MFKLDPTLTAAATAIAERIIKDALRLDPATRARLVKLDETTLQVRSDAIALNIFITISNGDLLVKSHAEQVDVSVSGTPLALARLALEEDKQQTLRDGAVKVDGNTETAEAFQAIIADLNIDWEAGLAEVIGDIPAHFLGQRLRNALKWGNQARNKFEQDIADYVQEESHSLPNRFEVAQHMDHVDELRLNVDRLQARIQAITHKLQNKPA